MKEQTFLGYDIFRWGDDTVFGEIQDSKLPPGLGITKLYDFPLGRLYRNASSWS